MNKKMISNKNAGYSPPTSAVFGYHASPSRDAKYVFRQPFVRFFEGGFIFLLSIVLNVTHKQAISTDGSLNVTDLRHQGYHSNPPPSPSSPFLGVKGEDGRCSESRALRPGASRRASGGLSWQFHAIFLLINMEGGG